MVGFYCTKVLKVRLNGRVGMVGFYCTYKKLLVLFLGWSTTGLTRAITDYDEYIPYSHVVTVNKDYMDI